MRWRAMCGSGGSAPGAPGAYVDLIARLRYTKRFGATYGIVGYEEPVRIALTTPTAAGHAVFDTLKLPTSGDSERVPIVTTMWSNAYGGLACYSPPYAGADSGPLDISAALSYGDNMFELAHRIAREHVREAWPDGYDNWTNEVEFVPATVDRGLYSDYMLSVFDGRLARMRPNLFYVRLAFRKTITKDNTADAPIDFPNLRGYSTGGMAAWTPTDFFTPNGGAKWNNSGFPMSTVPNLTLYYNDFFQYPEAAGEDEDGPTYYQHGLRFCITTPNDLFGHAQPGLLFNDYTAYGWPGLGTAAAGFACPNGLVKSGGAVQYRMPGWATSR